MNCLRAEPRSLDEVTDVGVHLDVIESWSGADVDVRLSTRQLWVLRAVATGRIDRLPRYGGLCTLDGRAVWWTVAVLALRGPSCSTSTPSTARTSRAAVKPDSPRLVTPGVGSVGVLTPACVWASHSPRLSSMYPPAAQGPSTSRRRDLPVLVRPRQVLDALDDLASFLTRDDSTWVDSPGLGAG